MKTRIKILLTLPSLVSLAYMFMLMNPAEFHWVTPNMKIYYIQVGVIQALSITQIIICIKKVWSFKALEKEKKKGWTAALILFSSLSVLVFIWKMVDGFAEENRLLSLEQAKK